jgi:hypothetical protein
MKVEVRKFLLKLGLIFSPFVILIVIELFVLPPDHFTFRFYETIRIGHFNSELYGPFYPNVNLDKIEQGDLAPYTPYAVKRRVILHTDRYGYRKVNTQRRSEVVIIGDSYIWGSGLSQDEMLSEILEKKWNVGVYPYAPSEVNSFLRDGRFIKDPPKTVIVSSIERYLCDLPKIDEEILNGKRIAKESFWYKSDLLQQTAVTIDRIWDSRMYNFYKKRVFSVFSSRLYVKRSKMLFLQGESANKDGTKEEIDRYASVIEGYCNYFKGQNIEFLFLPIPNKENIYYEIFPSQEKPNLLSELIKELEKRNVPVINTQTAFDSAYKNEGKTLYQLDDSHWNIEGVEVAAHLIDSALVKRNKTKEQ